MHAVCKNPEMLYSFDVKDSTAVSHDISPAIGFARDISVAAASGDIVVIADRQVSTEVFTI